MRWLMVFAIAILGLSACAVRRVHHPRHNHPEWVVVAGHRHDDNCGHYHHKGRWYTWEGHRHGHG